MPQFQYGGLYFNDRNIRTCCEWSCDYCFLHYGKYEFIIDNDDFIEIRDNFTKTFKLDTTHIYPYYKENNKEINILEYLFHFNFEENIYIFKNKFLLFF